MCVSGCIRIGSCSMVEPNTIPEISASGMTPSVCSRALNRSSALYSHFICALAVL